MKNKKFEKEPFYGCPIEAALDVIGNKWKGVILYHLMNGTKRFNELRRLIPHVSQRILTLQLRELEQDNILIRTIYPEVPPKVEYALTDLGQNLKNSLVSLEEWGLQLMERAR